MFFFTFLHFVDIVSSDITSERFMKWMITSSLYRPFQSVVLWTPTLVFVAILYRTQDIILTIDSYFMNYSVLSVVMMTLCSHSVFRLKWVVTVEKLVCSWHCERVEASWSSSAEVQWWYGDCSYENSKLASVSTCQLPWRLVRTSYILSLVCMSCFHSTCPRFDSVSSGLSYLCRFKCL